MFRIQTRSSEYGPQLIFCIIKKTLTEIAETTPKFMSENLEKEISVDIAKPQKILKEKKYKKLDK